jgi:hypothetical protein
MWLLVIILLSPLTDAEQVILNSFTSYEECQPEGDRVGLELAESYPDKVFRIMCAFRASPEVLAHHQGEAVIMFSPELRNPEYELAGSRPRCCDSDPSRGYGDHAELTGSTVRMGADTSSPLIASIAAFVGAEFLSRFSDTGTRRMSTFFSVHGLS